MKARVKATGEILEVFESCVEDFPWTDEMGDKIWKTEELMFLEDTEYIPDYWTRLEHQYIGMAMQSILQTMSRVSDPDKYMKAAIDLSVKLATTIVEKLREKEERK